ncbi:uncharacterized protein BJ171DRAFT_111470 [Polychytrium aggregatum]|uniref:uncharacterized protein n=1 Tax=Polychytrium aggregatum TaxID=110093 RepID=UPI0022FF32DD|nr:uncharacterized protein BJ171DRAFT_111470 [Polychytrium aggregatum]KAI9209225.1 hypothetical protein BJ171DRAFT_111470 [Polychytrium aggregatum]
MSRLRARRRREAEDLSEGEEDCPSPEPAPVPAASGSLQAKRHSAADPDALANTDSSQDIHAENADHSARDGLRDDHDDQDDDGGERFNEEDDDFDDDDDEDDDEDEYDDDEYDEEEEVVEYDGGEDGLEIEESKSAADIDVTGSSRRANPSSRDPLADQSSTDPSHSAGVARNDPAADEPEEEIYEYEESKAETTTTPLKSRAVADAALTKAQDILARTRSKATAKRSVDRAKLKLEKKALAASAAAAPATTRPDESPAVDKISPQPQQAKPVAGPSPLPLRRNDPSATPHSGTFWLHDNRFHGRSSRGRGRGSISPSSRPAPKYADPEPANPPPVDVAGAPSPDLPKQRDSRDSSLLSRSASTSSRSRSGRHSHWETDQDPLNQKWTHDRFDENQEPPDSRDRFKRKSWNTSYGKQPPQVQDVTTSSFVVNEHVVRIEKKPSTSSLKAAAASQPRKASPSGEPNADSRDTPSPTTSHGKPPQAVLSRKSSQPQLYRPPSQTFKNHFQKTVQSIQQQNQAGQAAPRSTSPLPQSATSATDTAGSLASSVASLSVSAAAKDDARQDPEEAKALGADKAESDSKKATFPKHKSKRYLSQKAQNVPANASVDEASAEGAPTLKKAVNAPEFMPASSQNTSYVYDGEAAPTNPYYYAQAYAPAGGIVPLAQPVGGPGTVPYIMTENGLMVPSTPVGVVVDPYYSNYVFHPHAGYAYPAEYPPNVSGMVTALNPADPAASSSAPPRSVAASGAIYYAPAHYYPYPPPQMMQPPAPSFDFTPSPAMDSDQEGDTIASQNGDVNSSSPSYQDPSQFYYSVPIPSAPPASAAALVHGSGLMTSAPASSSTEAGVFTKKPDLGKSKKIEIKKP